MKKLTVKLFLALIAALSLSTFTLAFGLEHVQFKSAVNTAFNGKCMDIPIFGNGPGDFIQQFGCHNGINQRFTIVPIFSKQILRSDLNPNLCIGLTDPSFADSGVPIKLIPCRNSNGDFPLNVRWEMDIVNGKTRFRAINLSHDRRSTCIDVPSALAQDGLPLQLFFCHDGGNQQWTF
jgi:hypothetical protein